MTKREETHRFPGGVVQEAHRTPVGLVKVMAKQVHSGVMHGLQCHLARRKHTPTPNTTTIITTTKNYGNPSTDTTPQQQQQQQQRTLLRWSRLYNILYTT